MKYIVCTNIKYAEIEAEIYGFKKYTILNNIKKIKGLTEMNKDNTIFLNLGLYSFEADLVHEAYDRIFKNESKRRNNG